MIYEVMDIIDGKTASSDFNDRYAKIMEDIIQRNKVDTMKFLERIDKEHLSSSAKT